MLVLWGFTSLKIPRCLFMTVILNLGRDYPSAIGPLFCEHTLLLVLIKFLKALKKTLLIVFNLGLLLQFY